MYGRGSLDELGPGSEPQRSFLNPAVPNPEVEITQQAVRDSGFVQ